MARISIFDHIHRSTARDYLARVLAGNKADFAILAKKFGEEYWDGSRHTGYGGYKYDGRWIPFARLLAAQYQLKAGQRVLDIGCGKGYLLFDLLNVVPGLDVAGIDVSSYALSQAKVEIADKLSLGDASDLSRFSDQSFDLVLSVNTLHNLQLPNLWMALREMERVSRGHKYIVMDSYETEQEKVNLMYWQLTCECFFTPTEWEFIFQKTGYTGDYDVVTFP